jgi:DNA-binding NarL/FixJ family response regulator
MSNRLRIVIATEHPGESQAFAEWLASDGFEPVPVSSVRAAKGVTETRPFDLLISDAKFAFRDGLHAHVRGRMRNPHTPIVVVGDDDSAARDADRRQAMFLERPVDRAALLCYVAMAAGEARPARRSPRKMVGRFEALIDGAPSALIDVSAEGLRLESARNRKVTPPYFSVEVPIVGVTLMVQRVWTNGRVDPKGQQVILYGGALAYNPLKIEHRWRKFVDAVPTS